MRHVDTIMIHASATRRGWWIEQPIEAIRDEIALWHTRDRGWNGIGYTELIGQNGDWCIGRDLDGDGDPWEEVGAGARGHNKNVIHICLIGGFGSSANDNFEDHFTVAQDAVLRNRIEILRQMFPSIKRVIGHNEVAAKGCPGFQVSDWLLDLPPRTMSASKTLGGAVVGGAATVGTGVTAVGALDGNAQLLVIAFVGIALLALLVIGRERIKAWARGVR